jgi:DNA-binding CsgD family transcriptional regulator
VIRDDERVAVLFGLPRALDIDPAYLDAIAIERACAGERLRLTDAERRAAVMVLVDRGYSVTRIARRLHLSQATARALLAELLADLDPAHVAIDQADDASVDGRAA